jgi:hypothetical protein
MTFVPVVVVYASNLSYLGGRGQEDLGSRPAQVKSFSDPISSSKKAIWKLLPELGSQWVFPPYRLICLE